MVRGAGDGDGGRLALRRLAWVLCAGCAALTLIGLVFVVRSAGVDTPVTFASRRASTLQAVCFLVLPGLGALIVGRHPRNPLGWLLIAIGSSIAVWIAADGWALHTLLVAPGALPLGIEAAWLANWIWAAGWSATAALFLLFPDGRLPSARWRPVAWLGAGTGLVAVATLMLAPGRMTKYPYLTNPFGIGAGPDAGQPDLAVVPLLCFGVVAFLSLGLRLRTATGPARQQLRALRLAAAVAVGVTVGWGVLTPLGVRNAGLEELSLVATSGVPIAAGLAVLRYRLSDVDALITRTLVYLWLSTLLAGVYTAAVLGLGLALRPFGTSSQLAVAASTLVTAALFQPGRTRIQRMVDRRFNRRQYDARLAVDAYRERLRDPVDLEQVTAELTAAAAAAVQPAHVSVWLRRD